MPYGRNPSQCPISPLTTLDPNQPFFWMFWRSADASASAFQNANVGKQQLHLWPIFCVSATLPRRPVIRHLCRSHRGHLPSGCWPKCWATAKNDAANWKCKPLLTKFYVSWKSSVANLENSEQLPKLLGMVMGGVTWHHDKLPKAHLWLWRRQLPPEEQRQNWPRDAVAM